MCSVTKINSQIFKGFVEFINVFTKTLCTTYLIGFCCMTSIYGNVLNQWLLQFPEFLSFVQNQWIILVVKEGIFFGILLNVE